MNHPLDCPTVPTAAGYWPVCLEWGSYPCHYSSLSTWVTVRVSLTATFGCIFFPDSVLGRGRCRVTAHSQQTKDGTWSTDFEQTHAGLCISSDFVGCLVALGPCHMLAYSGTELSMFNMEKRVCECVFFFCIVHRNRACLTWKSAIEIKLLLVLRVCSDFSSSASAFHIYFSGVHHFGWDFCVCDRFLFVFFFNPTIEVVTFRLRGYMLRQFYVLPHWDRSCKSIFFYLTQSILTPGQPVPAPTL